LYLNQAMDVVPTHSIRSCLVCIRQPWRYQSPTVINIDTR